jgi:YVTN family beta-propeller protein
MRSMPRVVGSVLVLGLLGMALLAVPAGAAPFAYITNLGSNNVSVIDTASNSVTATIPVCCGPSGVAVNPAGTRVYVVTALVSIAGSSVLVIDTASNSVMATIPVGSAPANGVAVNPAGTRVYVANFSDNNVSVIDTASNSVTATIPVCCGPSGVAVNPAGTRVYVANFSDNNVSVIDTASNSVTATIPVGFQPVGVAVNPAGTRVYVGTAFVSIGPGSVSVIDTASNSVTDTIPVGILPTGVAVNPAGTRVYVANIASDSVSVIDTASNSVTATIPVGFQPVGVAVNPAGTRVYVANAASDSVSVIDTASNSVTATIPVGSAPFSFGQFIMPAVPLTPFAAFTAKVEIELVPHRDDVFAVQSRFTLGAGSDGIDPLTEEVELALTGGTASLTTTIPAGSFTRDNQGRFEFEGTINGVNLRAQITPLGGNLFKGKVEGEHADLTGIANPVTVTLTIGNDRGSITVRAESE